MIVLIKFVERADKTGFFSTSLMSVNKFISLELRDYASFANSSSRSREQIVVADTCILITAITMIQ